MALMVTNLAQKSSGESPLERAGRKAYHAAMPLTLSMAQMRVARCAPAENLKKADLLMARAAERGSDLLCLPEMWTCGFDWAWLKARAGEHEAVISEVAALARKHRIWVNGSLPALNEEGRVGNASILFNAEGRQVARYYKIHLFSLIHEDAHLAAGRAPGLVETPWGWLGLSVCYDIRFPELYRTYALNGARLVLAPAAFPHARLAHWSTLLRARAIENQFFMAGINQVGEEDLGAAGQAVYGGHSCLISPWGETLLEAGDDQEELLTATINLDEADAVRSKMPVLRDRRPELYELGAPPPIRPTTRSTAPP